MKLATRTKNQHFVSQAEQRLNTCNPKSAPERQRVFSFLVADRMTCDIRLEKSDGIKIRNNLSWTDLFTFDSAELGLVTDLEAWFQNYERTITAQSQSLIRKLHQDGTKASIVDEVLNVFAAKFLNFLRNPYSVAKVLNTFRSALEEHPTNPQLAVAFSRIKASGYGQQQAVCERFGLTPDEYWDWLRALFLMLAPDPHHPTNLLEQFVRELFETKFVIVMIYDYSSSDSHHVCLLSDRGYSNPVNGDAMMAWDFNLTAKALIRYIFCDIDGMVPVGTDPDLIAGLKERRTVRVLYTPNDIDHLSKYNRMVVHQCYQRVYAASRSFVLAGADGRLVKPTA